MSINPTIREAFKKGTKVRIKGVSKTVLKYGLNEEMHIMVGKNYYVKCGSIENGIRIRGFIWDYDDLELISIPSDEKISVPKKVKFDIKEIWNEK